MPRYTGGISFLLKYTWKKSSILVGYLDLAFRMTPCETMKTICEVVIMTVIHSFRQKQREKEITLERSLLRELSIEWLKQKTLECFVNGIDSAQYIPIYQLEECCQDVAIEAYLLGGRFGKFGYFGETVEEVKKRCNQEIAYLVDTLFYYLDLEGFYENKTMIQESLYLQCDQYVHTFWMEGFLKSVKRYKLKLRRS